MISSGCCRSPFGHSESTGVRSASQVGNQGLQHLRELAGIRSSLEGPSSGPLCPPSFWSLSLLQSEDSAFSSDREEEVKFFIVDLSQDLRITRAREERGQG